jgi:predicted cupin superfamily sugar epimerase
MKKKELTPTEIDFINKVYLLIKDGQATRKDITDAYYLITQDNVQENHRMRTINNWVETNKAVVNEKI